MVEVLDPQDARERRDALLRTVHLSEDELADRAERYALTLDELEVADEVKGLTFIIGDR
ncbi:hypothetical protein [Demequina sp. NBRC 110053]|uniref:hypothetical protein n=1 Tax=Demequina sp. NBRC 110053 TaxID=1570342 RepID=UPI0013564489|nr:hypothetical protein [Demequina sp. NBRC 110053]